jgi:hypothetical protein
MNIIEINDQHIKKHLTSLHNIEEPYVLIWI